MKIRKKRQMEVRPEFLLILGLVVFVLAMIDLRDSQRVLGDARSEKNDGYRQDDDNEDDNKTDSKDEGNKGDNKNKKTNSQGNYLIIPPTILQTVIPAIQFEMQTGIQPTIGVVQPTTVPTVTQKASLETVMDQPSIKTVPISGTSVIFAPLVVDPTIKVDSAGTLIKSIKKGIESIGKGTVRPTEVPTPTPTTKPSITSTKKPEVALNKIKLKYRVKGDQVMLTAEDEKNMPIFVDEDDLRRVESSVLSRLEKNGVVLSLANNNQLAVSKGGVTAITDLPISVDVQSKSLIVTTTSGVKEVMVLPDKALKNIIDLGVVAEVNSGVVPKIEYSGGEVLYKFTGTKNYKMFGLVEVTVPITISVSANSGDEIPENQALITRVVRRLGSEPGHCIHSKGLDQSPPCR